MSYPDQFEKNNFRALVESDDIGLVEDQLNVIDTFLSTEEHVTLEDMMTLLKEKGYDYSTDFVRLCLNQWVHMGFAQKEMFEGQPPRYEHRHLGRHHDHLVCTKCGDIVEFRNDEMESLQLKVASRLGFHVLQHKMEIYGLCSKCVSERAQLIPLSSARPGEEIVIRDIIGGSSVKARLATMGFRQGDVIEVVSNDGKGRLIVGHQGTRLGIGRGMADKMIVASVPEKRPMMLLDRLHNLRHRKKQRKRRFFW
jgi:Fur family ferric uptake transcriptional regulator